ncbi:endonuclease G, mitochondrial-like [Rhagoletis pomonella]|uniref:endonuclease G, mitochondrial-like n=1 Tax=Rhagoletis pomonella TaxID=28610 RepID=UPI00177D4EEE|nr:endonuclease G, mitochondrial-like [Rhagoletis pomonella]
MVMLYHPWRDEHRGLIENDNEQTCVENHVSIEENQRQYDVFDQRELENVLNHLRDEVDVETIEQHNPPVVDNEFRVLALPEIDPGLNLLDINEGDPSNNDGDSGGNRESYYQADMSVPSNFRADLTDYRDSRFDRGHLAAAGNHKCHQTHCNETFYLTNIAPQVGKGFNRDAWNNLEIYVRELTERYGSVYVCTGPIYKPKRQLRGVNDAENCRKVDGKWCVEYEVIGENTVAVPTHFFKVITVESKLPGGPPYMEAYIMPNAPISSSTNIRNFLADIREIEHIAGLQFFNGLRRSFFFGTNYSTACDIYRNFV